VCLKLRKSSFADSYEERVVLRLVYLLSHLRNELLCIELDIQTRLLMPLSFLVNFLAFSTGAYTRGHRQWRRQDLVCGGGRN